MNRKELLRRYIVFIVALFITSFGVSFIIRSFMGTSPISSIPYVMSVNTPLSMGTYNFILNLFLIAGQMILLGKDGIKKKSADLLMQIPISVLFGAFIDLTMAMLSGYTPELYIVRLLSLVLGCAILSLGVSLEVIADVTMLSGEYFVHLVSQKSKKEFGTIKMLFDGSLVVIAAVLSLALSGHIEGLREGTLVAVLVTGPFVRLFTPHLQFVKRWETKPGAGIVAEPAEAVHNQVIVTISREYGSGGHLIGEMVSKKLGIKFYDKEIISLAAKESGFSEQFISEREQEMPSSILYQMIMQDYEVPLEKSLSAEDAIFVTQSRVIRHLAEEGPCVIVGRCADYVLRDYPNCIKVFLYADMEHKRERAVKEFGLSEDGVEAEIERINRSRSTHYYHFTGNRWEDFKNYQLICDTGAMSAEQICNTIADIYKAKKAVANK